MTLLEQLHNCLDATSEQKLQILRSEMKSRIPVIKGYGILMKQWLESQASKDMPAHILPGIDKIIETSEEVELIVEILTSQSK